MNKWLDDMKADRRTGWSGGAPRSREELCSVSKRVAAGDKADVREHGVEMDGGCSQFMLCILHPFDAVQAIAACPPPPSAAPSFDGPGSVVMVFAHGFRA